MRLTWQTCYPPTSYNTFETVTFVQGSSVDKLILLEYGRQWNVLLEQTSGEVNFVGNRATVDLDLHQVSFLLAKFNLLNLCVCKNANNSAMVLDALNFTFSVLGLLCSFLCVLGECLLLAFPPVLVETTTALLAQVLRPYGGDRAQTVNSFFVTNNTNDNSGGII